MKNSQEKKIVVEKYVKYHLISIKKVHAYLHKSIGKIIVHEDSNYRPLCGEK
jgi:hypothetical protein